MPVGDLEDDTYPDMSNTGGGDAHVVGGLSFDVSAMRGRYLFNVTADPTERVNLFEDERFAKSRALLEARLMRHQQYEVKSRWQASVSTPYEGWVANGGFLAPWL